MTGRKRLGPRGWHRHPNRSCTAPQPQRSAANWLLDAACYLRDGDRANARIAAARALRLLMVRR